MIQPCEYFLSLNRGRRTSRYGYEWRGSRVHPRSLPALCAIRRQRTPEKPFRQRRGLRLRSRLKYKHDLRHYQAFSVLFKISDFSQSGNLLGEYLRTTNARSVMNSFRTPFRPSFYQHDLSDFVQSCQNPEHPLSHRHSLQPTPLYQIHLRKDKPGVDLISKRGLTSLVQCPMRVLSFSPRFGRVSLGVPLCLALTDGCPFSVG